MTEKKTDSENTFPKIIDTSRDLNSFIDIRTVVKPEANSTNHAIKMICHAYEQGFGYGVNNRQGFDNPYAEGSSGAIAWQHGYEEGNRKYSKHLGEQAIPYEAALELFKLHLIDRLIKKGHPFGAANEILEKAKTYDPEIDQMLRQICLDILPHRNKKIKTASLSGAFTTLLHGSNNYVVRLASKPAETLYETAEPLMSLPFAETVKYLTQVVSEGKWPYDVLPDSKSNEFVELWFDGDGGDRYFCWLKLGRKSTSSLVTVLAHHTLPTSDFVTPDRKRFRF